MPKVFIACLGTETNTFSPLPTGWQTFDETTLYRGDATQHSADLFTEPLHVWRRRTEELQGTVVESIAAFAQPAGLTVREVYESLRDELLSDLRAALPVDMVLINMHGAMVADGYLDCEGDLLSRIRATVGPDTVIGGELDLHCSVTPLMVESADALITYKEYPHVDGGHRAEELFTLCLAAQRGEVKPVMEVHDCRMISMWRTPVEPTRGLVDDMQAQEGQDGVLSVSFAHGFPWGDVPDASAKVLVVADGDRQRARETAALFGERIWSLRHESGGGTISIDEALDAVQAASPGPLVLADIADNAGGGAPSDSTFLLRAILDRGLTNVASGYYWDPVAVRFCVEAGVGARFDLRVGGKCGPMSGDPIDLRIEVLRILEDAGQTFGSTRNGLGTAVWVRAEGELDLVLNTARSQVFHPDGFTQLGLDLSQKRAVVVKSTQHFYDGFAPLAERILYVATEGAIAPDFAAIPYETFKAPYWPRVENPFAEQP